MARKKKGPGRPVKQKSPEQIKADVKRICEEMELDIIDKEILKMKSLDPLLTTRQIALKLGVHQATIAYRLKKPRFRQVWDSIMETTTQAMERNARRAAQRLYQLIDHKNERIALEAIKLALSPWINQYTHQVSIAQDVTYKTTVQPDGSLLQEVIDAEVKTLPEPQKYKTIDQEIEAEL